MQAVKAGGLYFALVFGAGFVFGTSWGVVARPGCRDAEGRIAGALLMLSLRTYYVGRRQDQVGSCPDITSVLCDR